MFFNYFNQIASPGVDYNLTINKTTDGRLVVSLLSKVRDLDDPAQHHIRPMTLSGTPQELDQGFFPAVAAPVQKASGLLVGMADYEAQLAKAAEESKAAKKEKEDASKEAKAKKEKYDGFMKKAGEMETAGNLDDAIAQLQQARLHATDKATKTVDAKITELREKKGQGSLFGAESAPAPVPSPQPQPAVAAPTPVSAPAPSQTPESAPANGQSLGMFGPQPQPQAAPPTQPQPATNPYRSGQPSAAAPAYRESDYAEFQDFPSEMLPPPIMPTNPGAMAF